MSSENVARRVALDHGGLPVNPALRPRFFSRLFSKTVHVYPGGIFHFTRAARDLSQFAQWRGPRLGLVRRLGPHSIMDRGASIVSGLSSGFSAYSHEIECVFAFVVVPENDSRACSIRAVRPTLPRGY